jgi:hypothetical protein
MVSGQRRLYNHKTARSSARGMRWWLSQSREKPSRLIYDCAIPIVNLSAPARDGLYYEAVRRCCRMPVVAGQTSPFKRPGLSRKRMMQKIIEFRDAASQAVRSPAAQPLSVEPILAVVDSLSRTLECIKSLCATAPNGSVRDELETERANLVIGLFVARVAAMRVSLAEAAPEE